MNGTTGPKPYGIDTLLVHFLKYAEKGALEAPTAPLFQGINSPEAQIKLAPYQALLKKITQSTGEFDDEEFDHNTAQAQGQ